MGVEKQNEFVWKLLKENAALLGIDVDQSGYGLMDVVERLNYPERDWVPDPDDVAEGDRLLREFGSTNEGVDLLYALGDACNFASGLTWVDRTWEKIETIDDFKSAGWSCLEERTLCDFAMYAGVAAVACQSFKSNSEGRITGNLFSILGEKGAAKRHAPMAKLRAWSIEKYRAGTWQSANQAAHQLKESVISHGRTINANLSEENAQRTIAEWFRRSV